MSISRFMPIIILCSINQPYKYDPYIQHFSYPVNLQNLTLTGHAVFPVPL